VKSHLFETPVRVAVLALCGAALVGCSALGDVFSGDKVDYRGSATKGKALEVPPDLTQLARDTRYSPQGGVVSASGASGAAAPVIANAAAPAVALQASGGMRVERAGQQRWLVVPLAPEALWPALRAFWEQKGFSLNSEDAKAGTMETNWAENRTKLPQDVVRNTIGRLLGSLYDTGERDQYRTRVERTASGSEIYIAHRGLAEVYTSERKDNTTWRARPSDPQLEAELLAQLMVSLGAKEEPARATVAAAAEPAARARAVAAGATALEIDDPFDRAWRRVGLALDRGGFTVEDRDRAGGIYFVRYVDPKSAGKEEPGFWSRMFGDGSNPQAAVRYRVALKGNGDKTTATVQTSAGGADVGENGQRIAALLISELK
jgi:outer membrane protein assembly factor BamC